jgi:hypothetical protein
MVWNRTDGNLGRRLEGFSLVVLDGARREVFRKDANLPAPRLPARRFPSTSTPPAASAAPPSAPSSAWDTEPAATFAELAGLIARGQDVAAAAQGHAPAPAQCLAQDQAATATASLVRWAKAVPATERTREDYVQAMQTAVDLAGLLPSAEAAAVRRDLRDLRVAVFVIRTVREGMRYDTPRLVVEAGKPFEIIIQNDDFMPHNLAVVNPGRPRENRSHLRQDVARAARLQGTRVHSQVARHPRRHPAARTGHEGDPPAHRAREGRRLRVRLHLPGTLARHVGPPRRHQATSRPTSRKTRSPNSPPPPPATTTATATRSDPGNGGAEPPKSPWVG